MINPFRCFNCKEAFDPHQLVGGVCRPCINAQSLICAVKGHYVAEVVREVKRGTSLIDLLMSRPPLVESWKQCVRCHHKWDIGAENQRQGDIWKFL